MEIETVAEKLPKKFTKFLLIPKSVWKIGCIFYCVSVLNPQEAVAEAAEVLRNLYKCFGETDSSLAEVNPLVLTKEKKRYCFGQK